MNLPNKLTLSRVIMVPFFVVFILLVPKFLYFKWIALAIFIIASLTDLLDGKIARKYNLVTNFGKFTDPLADKLLVCSALIAMSSLGVIPAWITIVIIAREFIISGFRLIAAEKGVVIAASMWGKWKTTFQMVMLCVQMVVMNQYVSVNGNNAADGLYVVTPFYQVLMMIGSITMYIALILTVVSLIDYLLKNKDVLKDVD
ncbi:MAG: CDP-diacylglycerol--glycerol-3-phosphate 3-phosphatidyltransferase [Lachnospiraceae bacterium]|nr:CDP-diacylglycerol--glycerol-3-phosphate 3-phosphatidyltransferase [Lachnospiraceae bacterium]